MRYVMANRRAGKYQRDEQIASRSSLVSALALLQSPTILADRISDDPTARRVIVIDAQPGEIEVKRAQFASDVMIEPEILYFPSIDSFSHTCPSDFEGVEPSGGSSGSGSRLHIEVRGQAHGSLEDARVTVYARGPKNAAQAWSGMTDASGSIDFTIDPGFTPGAVVVIPAHSFWPMIVRGPETPVTVQCPSLPQNGPYGWWHRALGSRVPGRPYGHGIKVGIVDTGCGPSPCLSHVHPVGAFIGGQQLPSSDAEDIQGHGTHVSGIIGARPSNPGEYAGITDGAELFAARVFAPGQGANQADIANAIDVLSREYECDLLNLSLGSKERSDILEDSIRDAAERGSLCVCAAGNNTAAVNYPAAYDDCIAVSAVGLASWGPDGSLCLSRLPDKRDRYGIDNYYLANFSSIGAEITCAAPGVGIISTVKSSLGQSARYAAMDGTSMASPSVCGSLAVLLSQDSTYRMMARNIHRAGAARACLLARCRPLGLVSEYEGRGMPFAL